MPQRPTKDHIDQLIRSYRDRGAVTRRAFCEAHHITTSTLDYYLRRAVIESIVETEYAPCACTPLGKVKRVSLPHKPGEPAIWTVYSYDELGRVISVMHPPNSGISGSSGTTTYLYEANTVKVTDPAGRWKKYTMDGFGNLTSVEEPKPSGGTYLTSYTYTMFGELKTVSMTRDGYNGHTPLQVTQTRSFEYEGTGNGQLLKTTFPETPGSTEYGYSGDQLLWKKNYKGVWKYFYTGAKQLARVEKYPGATDYYSAVNEDVNGRVVYHYDTHSLQTDFVGENTVGRLAAMEYSCGAQGMNCTREFYSYTRGGRLKKKRLEATLNGLISLEVRFEYDAEGKLEFMVYPSGKRVKYTYDDLARHTGLRNVDQYGGESEIVNNLAYGTAGELKSMSWLNDPNSGQWASQSWSYNNRLQMTGYGYSVSGQLGASISHTYQYSASNNDGKLSSRTDTISGEQVVYLYDSLHRLVSANAGASWSQQYFYDGFGNMKKKTGTGQAQYQAFDVPLASATNGGGAAGGDMDDRRTQNGKYGYAPDNKRIYQQFYTSEGRTHFYLWVGSMRVGTYQAVWPANSPMVLTVVKEDLYVAGRRVAPSDRLGSDLSGGLKLLPYGEEVQPPNVPSDRTKFATYHRDEDGWDYADQRYYSPGSGRFMTADPYIASGGASDPNSWNRFAYVEGDPVNHVDPEGLKLGEAVPAGDMGGMIYYGGIGSYSYWNGEYTTTYYGPVAFSSQGGGGGSEDVTTNADRLKAARLRIQVALDTPCANAIGAADAAEALKVVKGIDISFSDLGAIKLNVAADGSQAPLKGSGSTARYNPVLGFRNIKLNSQIDWANPNNTRAVDQNNNPVSYRALDGQANSLGISSINAQEFMDLTILHELAHRFGRHEIDSDPEIEKAIWRECFQ